MVDAPTIGEDVPYIVGVTDYATETTARGTSWRSFDEAHTEAEAHLTAVTQTD